MKCDAFTSTVSPLWIRDGRQVSSASIVGTCSTSPQPPFAMAASAIWLLIFPVTQFFAIYTLIAILQQFGTISTSPKILAVLIVLSVASYLFYLL